MERTTQHSTKTALSARNVCVCVRHDVIRESTIVIHEWPQTNIRSNRIRIICDYLPFVFAQRMLHAKAPLNILYTVYYIHVSAAPQIVQIIASMRSDRKCCLYAISRTKHAATTLRIRNRRFTHARFTSIDSRAYFCVCVYL